MKQLQEQEIRLQLDRIFASPRFKDAGRARRFLEFVVAETLAGNSAGLKENIVGINVFDRSTDYDPRLDSIVRVEAGRLRTKLSDYYQDEGRDDPVVIALPKGSYAPEIASRESISPLEPEPQSDLVVAPMKLMDVSNQKLKRRGLIAAGILLVVGLSIKWIAMFIGLSTPDVRIAVLPFTYSALSGDRVLITQLTEKVTAEFVKLGTYDVVPSTSARTFENHRPGVREMAKELQADILLEARVTIDANIIIVECRLSDGALDRKFWVEDKISGEDIDELAKQLALAANQAVASRWKGRVSDSRRAH